MTLNIPSFIITMHGEPISESLANDCLYSTEKFGIQPKIFNGTHGEQIDSEWKQHNLKEFKFNKRIKKLNRGAIGCTISHLKLWKKCIELQSPILILEHDALMIRNIPQSILDKFEDVCNLDWLSRITTNYDTEVTQDRGQAVNLFKVKRPPYSGLELYNKSHIKGAHSYIVKPQGAKKLIDWLWAHGVLSADVVINSVACKLSYSNTSYFRINPKYWNAKRMKGKKSFTRPTIQDKLLMKEKNVI